MVQIVSLPTNAEPPIDSGKWVHIYQRTDGKFMVEIGEDQPAPRIRYTSNLPTFVVASKTAKEIADQIGVKTVHVMGY